MIIPIPNTMAAMSSKNTTPMRKYPNPFVIHDGNAGRCGRTRESRAGDGTSFCGLWSTHILSSKEQRLTCPLNIRNECSITCTVINAKKSDCKMQPQRSRHPKAQNHLRRPASPTHPPRTPQRRPRHLPSGGSLPKCHLECPSGLFDKHLWLLPQYEKRQQAPRAHEIEQCHPFLHARRPLECCRGCGGHARSGALRVHLGQLCHHGCERVICGGQGSGSRKMEMGTGKRRRGWVRRP